MDIQDFNESPFGRDEPRPSLLQIYLVVGLEALAFIFGLIGAAFDVDQAALTGFLVVLLTGWPPAAMLLRRRITGKAHDTDRSFAAGLAFAAYGFLVVVLFVRLFSDFG